MLASLTLAALVAPLACSGREEVTPSPVDHPAEGVADDARADGTAGGGNAGDDRTSGEADPIADADSDADAIADADAHPRSTTPLLHRPVAGACTQPRPASSELALMYCTGASWCQTSAGDAGPCTDTSCTSGANGRCECLWEQNACGSHPICTYDDCASDADCGAGWACLCRETSLPAGLTATASDTRRTVCVAASCRVDSDCGAGGYCSPSPSIACNDWFDVQYRCHTPADECLSDSDCSPPNARPSQPHARAFGRQACRSGFRDRAFGTRGSASRFRDCASAPRIRDCGSRPIASR
jgi:hypothetical protein